MDTTIIRLNEILTAANSNDSDRVRFLMEHHAREGASNIDLGLRKEDSSRRIVSTILHRFIPAMVAAHLLNSKSVDVHGE